MVITESLQYKKYLIDKGIYVFDCTSNGNRTWLAIMDRNHKDYNISEILPISVGFLFRGVNPWEINNILRSGIDNPTRKVTWVASRTDKALEYGNDCGNSEIGQLLCIYGNDYFLPMVIRKDRIESDVEKELYKFTHFIRGTEYLGANERYHPGYDRAHGRAIDPTKSIHPQGMIFIADNIKQKNWMQLAINVHKKSFQIIEQ